MIYSHNGLSSDLCFAQSESKGPPPNEIVVKNQKKTQSLQNESNIRRAVHNKNMELLDARDDDIKEYLFCVNRLNEIEDKLAYAAEMSHDFEEPTKVEKNQLKIGIKLTPLQRGKTRLEANQKDLEGRRKLAIEKLTAFINAPLPRDKDEALIRLCASSVKLPQVINDELKRIQRERALIFKCAQQGLCTDEKKEASLAWLTTQQEYLRRKQIGDAALIAIRSSSYDSKNPNLLKSANKLNTLKEKKAELARVINASVELKKFQSSFPTVKENLIHPENLLQSTALNCGELELATESWIAENHPDVPVSRLTFVGFHICSVIGTFKPEYYNLPMSQWKGCHIVDSWLNISCPAEDFESEFLSKMQKWDKDGKLILQDPHWLRPTSDQWMGMLTETKQVFSRGLKDNKPYHNYIVPPPIIPEQRKLLRNLDDVAKARLEIDVRKLNTQFQNKMNKAKEDKASDMELARMELNHQSDLQAGLLSFASLQKEKLQLARLLPEELQEEKVKLEKSGLIDFNSLLSNSFPPPARRSLLWDIDYLAKALLKEELHAAYEQHDQELIKLKQSKASDWEIARLFVERSRDWSPLVWSETLMEKKLKIANKYSPEDVKKAVSNRLLASALCSDDEDEKST